jgi:hypothetical protein
MSSIHCAWGLHQLPGVCQLATVRQSTLRLCVLSSPVRPIRTVHLDDLALKAAKSPSGMTPSVIGFPETTLVLQFIWNDVDFKALV